MGWGSYARAISFGDSCEDEGQYQASAINVLAFIVSRA